MDDYKANRTIPEYCNDIDFRLSTFVIVGIIAAVLTAFGIAANVVVIKVLSRPNFRYPTTIILIALAAVDILYLLFFFFTLPVFNWLEYFEYARGHHVHMKSVAWLNPLWKAACAACAYVTVAAAVERLLAVACPHRCRCISGRLCACMLVAVALICATLLHMPRVSSWTAVRSARCPGHSWNAYYLDTSAASWLGNWYGEPILSALGRLWPFAALCAVCALVAIGRRRRAGSWSYAEESKSDPTSALYERHLSAMVLGAAALYILCALPTAGVTLVELVGPPSVHRLLSRPAAQTAVNDVSQLLTVINSSAKLPVYWALSAEFRRRTCHKAEHNAVEV